VGEGKCDAIGIGIAFCAGVVGVTISVTCVVVTVVVVPCSICCANCMAGDHALNRRSKSMARAIVR
jgi:hypothetical protein